MKIFIVTDNEHAKSYLFSTEEKAKDFVSTMEIGGMFTTYSSENVKWNIEEMDDSDIDREV